MLVGNDKEYIKIILVKKKIILVPNATMVVLMPKKKKKKIDACPEAYLKFKIPSGSGAGEQMQSRGLL